MEEINTHESQSGRHTPTPSSIIGVVLTEGETEDGIISIGGSSHHRNHDNDNDHIDPSDPSDIPIVYGGPRTVTVNGSGERMSDLSMIISGIQAKSQYSPHSGGLVSVPGQCVSVNDGSSVGHRQVVQQQAERLQEILLSGGGGSVTAFPNPTYSVRDSVGNHHLQGNFLENGFHEKINKKQKNLIKSSRSNLVLPSSIAIPIGLAQVIVGGSMVICGSFAVRYQSYLFYYGSGLWAGTLAGIAGILGVMATKKGLPKPRYCGGRRWQIHVFLAAVMLALSTSILAAVFSTSGLIRDTQRDLNKDTDDMTPDEEMHEKRKSSGIAINAFLLLFALLQILLSFCSLGIALRVLCSRAYCSNNGSLLSSDENGSEVTVREILGDGTGPEYEARKDRLLRWLGHQRRHFIGQSNKAIMAAKQGHGTKATFDPRLYPTFVTSSTIPRNSYNQQLINHGHSHTLSHNHSHPQSSLPYVIPAGMSSNPRAIMGGNGPHSLPLPMPMSMPMQVPVAYPFPAQLVVPIIPLPIRQPRSQTPVSIGGLSGDKQKNRRRKLIGGSSSGSSSVGGKSRGTASSCGTNRKNFNTNSNTKKKEKKEKKKEIEVTEEEVGKTYTGLDRVVAEDFINNAMNHE